MEINGQQNTENDFTSIVNDEIDSRISAVNEHLKWELEYGQFVVDLNRSVHKAQITYVLR